MNPNDKGITTYRGGHRTSARRIFERVKEKCRLRAALEAVSAELDAAIPTLNSVEHQELRTLITGELKTADSDTAALQAKIAEEAELAQTTRAAAVTVSRRAAATLAMEAEKRIRRGSYPSIEGLISEAIAKAFGEGRP